MLLKTDRIVLPPRPKVEGTITRLDPQGDGYPTGFIMTGWSDGTIDANVLAACAKVVWASKAGHGMSPLQKRLARIVRYDPERKSKREIAEFLDKINRKTREARAKERG